MRPTSLIGLALALTLTGCVSPPPLLRSLDDPSTTVCTPVDDTGIAVFAISVVQRVPDAPVVLVDATLLEPEGVELAGLELRAVDTLSGEGTFVGLPEGDRAPEPIGSPMSFDGDPHRVVVVALRLRGERPGGTAGVRLQVADAAGRHPVPVDTAIRLEVVPSGSTCSG